MMASGFIAVGAGGAIGCWLRWWMAIKFNALTPVLPAGTLLANCVGGYCIGLAIGWFAGPGGIAPLDRLFFDLFKGVLALFL